MSHNIAIIDDEELILESLKWVFMGEPYNVLTFQSPLRALQELSSKQISVVVSDLMMPEMDGIAFLKEVKERCPDVECLIITANQNYNGLGFDCPIIYKPWNIICFKASIDKAVARYESKMYEKQNSDSQNKKDLVSKRR